MMVVLILTLDVTFSLVSSAFFASIFNAQHLMIDHSDTIMTFANTFETKKELCHSTLTLTCDLLCRYSNDEVEGSPVYRHKDLEVYAGAVGEEKASPVFLWYSAANSAWAIGTFAPLA